MSARMPVRGPGAKPSFLMVFVAALAPAAMTHASEPFQAPPAAAAPEEPPAKRAARVDIEPVLGSFVGTLQAGPQRLRLVWKIERGEGTLGKGLMDSLDQGASDIPLDRVELRDDRSVTVRCRVAQGAFEGVLSADGASLEGTWTQGGAALPLLMQRGEPPALKRPQEPKPPFPYQVQEVKVPQPDGGFVLAGSLTRPEGTAPVPAVLLITGSGAQDRDESLMGHKPFLLLADALTRAGIAVLRVDDRGVGGSGGSMATATTEDLARDAAAAYDWLRAQPGIDPSRVGLLGHSEGGMIAAILAGRRPDVGFAVLMAGPAQPGDALLVEQAGLLTGAAGADAAFVDALRKVLATLVAKAKDPTLAPAELAGALRGMLLASASDLPAGCYEVLDPYVAMLSSPWSRWFVAWDPAPALAAMRCPTLALYGERDLQVPAGSNAPLARAAFDAGGLGERATVRVVPGANHLFQACTTGSAMEYAQIEMTIDPSTLKELVDWVRTTTAR